MMAVVDAVVADSHSDVAMFTGIEVSAKAQQRLVQGYEFPMPTIDTSICEACVDGGKMRLRTPMGEPCIWRDYRAIDTNSGVVANFHSNLSLIEWLTAQPLVTLPTCLGHGQWRGVKYRRSEQNLIMMF